MLTPSADVAAEPSRGVAPSPGALLRDWRRKRGLSLSDLASDADVSPRYLGRVEIGRVSPGRELLLKLAGRLDLSLRDRNTLLEAAGFGPAFPQRPFAGTALEPIRRNLEALLAAYEPYPALLVDHHWTMLSANRALSGLVFGAEPLLLRPPVNLLRLALHPAGLAPRIVNLAEWRGAVIMRLRQQINASGDATLRDLLDEIWDYPCPAADPEGAMPANGVATPFRLATIDGEMSFLTMTTRVAMSADITVSDLAIEAFLPADAATAALTRRYVEARGGTSGEAVAGGPAAP